MPASPRLAFLPRAPPQGRPSRHIRGVQMLSRVRQHIGGVPFALKKFIPHAGGTTCLMGGKLNLGEWAQPREL